MRPERARRRHHAALVRRLHGAADECRVWVRTPLPTAPCSLHGSLAARLAPAAHACSLTHASLCRARSFLNGKAKPSEHVTVQIGGGLGGAYPTIADADGDWIIQANHAHGTVTVHGEDGPTLTAHNVSSGDVFFCSGQSNMVFPTKFTLNASAEIATLANYPQFRFFATARDYASTPQFDLKMSGPHWACDAKPCNQWLTTEMALKVQPGKLPKSPLPNTFIANFSAVCFMTVRDIAKMHTCKTGQCKPGRPGRPMALIQSAWGGTRVEAWMPTAAIEAAAQKVAPPNVFMPPKKKEQNNVSVLYNAMVAPWDKFAVRASIWYQGKPGVAEAADADALPAAPCLLPAACADATCCTVQARRTRIRSRLPQTRRRATR